MPALRLPEFDYATADAIMITTCAHPGAQPFRHDGIAAAAVEQLGWLRERHGVHLFVYCLMPDHLHLLLRLSVRGTSLSAAIGQYKNLATRRAWEHGHRGVLWQRRFHDRVLRQGVSARAAAMYIAANPVRAGLVDAVEQYPWTGFPDPM